MSLHVPAWKRLGLKLKYAKDEPDKILAEAHDRRPKFERPAKRQRLTQENTDITARRQNLANSNLVDPDAKKQARPSVKANKDNTSKRRKSVAFTDDTKNEDGDTRTTIETPPGSPGSTPKKLKTSAKNDVSNSSPIDGTSQTDRDEVDVTPAKSISKLEKSKKAKSSDHGTKDKTSSALDYLLQHRTDRQSWKFSKNRDVWILNNANDTEAIPASHTLALAGYVRGLPAKAGARTRLVKVCRQKLATGEAAQSLNPKQKQTFEEQLDSKDTSTDHEFHIQAIIGTVSRPVLLLTALGEDMNSNAGEVGPSSPAADTSMPTRKKKSRTAAPVELSSSGESDSDSDSSDSNSSSIPKSEARSKEETNAVTRSTAHAMHDNDMLTLGGSSAVGSASDSDTSSSNSSTSSSSDSE